MQMIQDMVKMRLKKDNSMGIYLSQLLLISAQFVMLETLKP